MSRNPFVPSFGTSPPVLAGRDELLDMFREGLREAPGAPAQATLYVGARGSGKTVMLNAVEDVAAELGWLAIAETASPGLVDRLVREHLPQALRELDPDATTTRLRGASALGVGAEWRTTDEHAVEPGLRTLVTRATDVLGAKGNGLLLTVDEIHAAEQAELRELGTVVQHAFRENRLLAFVGAGLPHAIERRLLNDTVLTFLRRADRHQLGRLEDEDVRAALELPIREAGRSLTTAALDELVAATDGYPFMVQLVGYHLWRQAGDAEVIDAHAARRAVPLAQERLAALVHEAALADVSEVDRSFLEAMALDDGPSAMRDIATRLGVTDGYASHYRMRLLAAQLIAAPRRGHVDFAVPYLREYLRNLA